jgi:biopolymer transport protein ExbB
VFADRWNLATEHDETRMEEKTEDAMKRTQPIRKRAPWQTWLRTSMLSVFLVVIAIPVIASSSLGGNGGNEPDGNPRPAKKAVETPQESIATTNVLRILRDGGLLMYPIAFCSLVMTAFAFERLIFLRYSRVIPKPFVSRFLQQVREGQLDREQALVLCEENESPIARVFAAASRKWGRPAVEVEQAALDAGERATNVLRRNIRVFSAVSTISPLLGLLGTVCGMIQAFNAVAASDAMGRPELLAHGVGQALLTTAFGLVVAVPALALYYLFVGRADRLIVDIDTFSEELVNLISAEEITLTKDESKPNSPKRILRRDAA